MITQQQTQQIISTPTKNNITFKEWEELPLGEEAKAAYLLGCNGFCSPEALQNHLVSEFQNYKDYVEATYDS